MTRPSLITQLHSGLIHKTPRFLSHEARSTPSPAATTKLLPIARKHSGWIPTARWPIVCRPWSTTTRASTTKPLPIVPKRLRLDPKNPWAYHKRGAARAAMGEYDKALADYADSLRVDPTNVWAYNAIAWLWATCPEAKVRDGKKAVEHATRACALSAWKDADSLDALAAAYAECGQFVEAIKWAQRAST